MSSPKATGAIFWSKRILKAFIWGFSSLVVLLLVSAVAIKMGVNIDLHAFFERTWGAWLIWRAALYGVLVYILYQLHRRGHANRQLIILVVTALAIVEGLNALYLMG